MVDKKKPVKKVNGPYKGSKENRAVKFVKNEMFGVDDFGRTIRYAKKGNWSKAAKSAATGVGEVGLTFVPGGAVIKAARTAKIAYPAARAVGKTVGATKANTAAKIGNAAELKFARSKTYGYGKVENFSGSVTKKMNVNTSRIDSAPLQARKKEKTKAAIVKQEYANSKAQKEAQVVYKNSKKHDAKIRNVISKRPPLRSTTVIDKSKGQLTGSDREFIGIAANQKRGAVDKSYYAAIGKKVQSQKPKSKVVKKQNSLPSSTQKDIRIGRAYVSKQQPKGNKVKLEPLYKNQTSRKKK